MRKNVPFVTSSALTTTLVFFGWVAFGVGFFVDNPLVKLSLLALARVLP